MTDQSKIPMPQDSADSLIERAARAYDLRSFSPPPVPGDLAPPQPKPAQRYRATMPEAVRPQPATPPPVTPQPVVHTEPSEPVEAVASVESVVAPVQTEKPVSLPATFNGVLHQIDRQHLRDQGLLVPEGAVTTLQEEFRIVKRQLLEQVGLMRRDGRGGVAQRVLVGSAHPGEGKTYCAVNLALSLSGEKENEVLLVDADFAKPSILGMLGLPGGPGLMDALTQADADVADFVLRTDIPGLSILPAGNATTSDSEYLASSRTAKVLDRLTEGAPQRIVIFDSPPVLAASPAAELAKHVGQAIVVVRADRTGQGALEDAISLLSGCPNIQLLLNCTSFSPSGRRFGAYYGYGE
ncbi:MAG TPA: capsular biosynthesis protein [Novosphingobium sp.]